MFKRMFALGAVTAVALGFVACGGDDDGETSATTAAAISEDEFVAQGNQICADGTEELDAAQEDAFSGGQPDAADLEAYVTDTFIPNIQGQIDALRALGAPEGQEDEVNQFLDDAQESLDALEDDPSSLGEDTFADVNEQAVELGIGECAG